MNLIIDAGNTLVKIAVYEDGKCYFFKSISLVIFLEEIKNFFKKHPNIKKAMVSSVSALQDDDINALKRLCEVSVLTPSTKIPFKNLYGTPKTLGVDRIALIAAAYFWHKNSNVLVIDAGSCVTYDIINDADEYLGGAISPGIAMRFKAMHNQTANLPLFKKEDILDFIGSSTKTSMQSGVLNGICLEIDGVINQYKVRFADLTVILTGGDAHFLSKRLKNTIFVHSNFLLDGLNYLLEYKKN